MPIRGWIKGLCLAALMAVSGCATPVEMPKFSPLADGALNSTEITALKSGPVVLTGPSAPKYAPLPSVPPNLPSVGGTNSAGITLDALWAKIYRSHAQRDDLAALAAIKAKETTVKEPLALWQLAILRGEALLTMGRAAEAEEEMNRASALEVSLFGTDVYAKTLRGEARLWLRDFQGAEADLGRVVQTIGTWRIPVSYGGPPTNLAQLVATTAALTRAHTDLGVLNLLQDNFAAAKQWANRAEVFYNDMQYLSEHPLYGSVLVNDPSSYHGRAMNLAVLGAGILVADGDAAKSTEFFDASKRFLKMIDFSFAVAQVDSLRAYAHLRAGKVEDALRIAEETVAEASKFGLTELLWQIEGIRGEVLVALGRKEAAERSFRRAQKAVEVSSGGLSTEASKRRFGIGKEAITRWLIKFDVERNDLNRLFDDLERGRARAFVDMLGDVSVAPGDFADLVREIRAVDNEIRRVRMQTAAPKAMPTPQTEQNLLNKRLQLSAQLRAGDPDLADALSISARSLSDVRKSLLTGETLAYVLPVTTGKPLSLLLVSKDKAEIKSLNGNPEQVEAELKRFAEAVMPNDVEDQKIAVSRLNILLSIKEWAPRKALYVVPSGIAHFIPWGALDVSIPVAVLPTGGWLLRRTLKIAGGDAVVVGDPNFFGKLPQLAGARLEAKMVGKLHNVVPLIGTAASENAVRSAFGNGVGMAHFATHGQFDSSNPLKSAIMLSKSGGYERLTAAKLFEQPLSSSLVILSACETGIGKAEAGDDFLGLPRSFYLGGATTVVSSLWPIQDEGTLKFMTVFHSQAKNGDYGGAWLAARNRLKKEGYSAAVYGAFVLVGSLGNAR